MKKKEIADLILCKWKISACFYDDYSFAKIVKNNSFIHEFNNQLVAQQNLEHGYTCINI